LLTGPPVPTRGPSRRVVLALGMIAPAALWAADPVPGHRRLGVLLHDEPRSWEWLKAELAQELATLGWVEGKNLSVEWRYAEGDATRLPPLAAELLRAGVDAVLTRGTPATQALQQATRTVPIVTGVGDPIGSGFARSYASPGGNITGVSWAVVEQQRKQIELLRELLPRLARLTVVLPANREAYAPQMTAAVQALARELGIVVKIAPVAGMEDLPRALRPDQGSGPGVSAALVFAFGHSIAPKDIAEAALRQRMPTVFEYPFYVEAGGLMSYRFHWDNQTRSTAVQLDKVFRRVLPAQIPFELPTRSEFVLNARTARALGLTIPPALRARADEVIE